MLRIKKLANQKELSFFGLPLAHWGTVCENGVQEKYFDIFPQTFEKKVLSKIVKQIPSGHDSVFLLRAGMGEAYVLSMLFKALLEKQNLKSPCLVGLRPQYADLCKMLFQNVPYYVINNNKDEMFQALRRKEILYKGILFNVNPSPLHELQKTLAAVESGTDRRHYIDILCDFNGVKTFEPPAFYFVDNMERQIREKVKGIDFNKFVFIVSDANFVKNMPLDFWETLKRSLREKGFNVFFNDPRLSIPEAVYLAKKAKGIVSLRCGFSEILSTLSVKKFIIQTACRWNDIKDMTAFLTLKKYPYVDASTIYEYDADKNDENAIISDIVRNI